MAGFLDTLAVKEVEGSADLWVLLEPCIYHLDSPDGAEFVEAPTGMRTDFGSIPRPLHGLPGLSPHGHYKRAYVIHDKLFVAPVVRTATSARPCSFSEANAILREAMAVIDECRGGNWFQRRARAANRAIVWTGVATGGRISWNRYRREQAERGDHVSITIDEDGPSK